MRVSDIAFPNLDIYFDNVSRMAFNLFGIPIAWYGVIVAIAVFFGTFIDVKEGMRQGHTKEFWTRFATIIIPSCVVGARIFYVIFTWDENSTLYDFLNFREGGLGFFGVILMAQLGAILYSKYHKVSVLKFMDIGNLGLIGGHIIGRWGNFVNREAFGSYTDNILAMRIRVDQIYQADVVSLEMLENAIVIDGITFIQVHPTFLYESLFLSGLLLFLWLYRKHKRFDGELTAYYFIGYGLFRSFIEILRTDPLPFFGFTLGASALAAIIMTVIGFVILIRGFGLKNLPSQREHKVPLEDVVEVTPSVENPGVKKVRKSKKRGKKK